MKEGLEGFMVDLDLTLYFITDSTGITERDFLNIIRLACEGGVSLVQLREKDKADASYLETARAVKEITDRYNVPLIIDDRADIALAVDAAGVHVGQSDIPVHIARRLMGERKIVGATAKTVEQAQRAEREGADYLGVGAIYPTTTKVITVITEIQALNDIAARVSLPVAAIGGLNASNIHPLYDSGAAGIAVVSAIMKSESPREAARGLKAQVVRNFKRS